MPQSIRLVMATASVLWLPACSQPAAPSPPIVVPATSAFTVAFGENPVPFRSPGCNAIVPGGWFTTARLQETGGVAFSVSTLTQKLDGSVTAALAESFGSRFGACEGTAFAPGMIPGNGAVCASVGACSVGTVGEYQFELDGTDANGRALTFTSPVLRFGARSVAQSDSRNIWTIPASGPPAVWPIRQVE